MAKIPLQKPMTNEELLKVLKESRTDEPRIEKCSHCGGSGKVAVWPDNTPIGWTPPSEEK